MLSYPEVQLNRQGTGHGKPVFPVMPKDISEELTDFIGPGSMAFFDIAKLDHSFLTKPVANWELETAYFQAKVVVTNLAVTNDAAERGVKLCADYLDSARKEKHFQDLIQVVENERARIPDKRNRNVEPKRWFLVLDEPTE